MSVGIAGAIHRQSNRAEVMIILVIDKIGIFDRGRFHRKGNDLRKQMKRWYREGMGEEIRASPKLFSTGTTSLLVTKEMGYYN